MVERNAGRGWWWILLCFGLLVAWAGGLMGWLLLMLLVRQWLLSTNPYVSSSVWSGHGQGILDGCLLCAVSLGRWGMVSISPISPCSPCHWISLNRGFPQLPPAISDARNNEPVPYEKVSHLHFQITQLLVGLQQAIHYHHVSWEIRGIWGKTCSSLYSTWRDCNSELPGGVHKTNLCHHPPSWFNNVHKSWFLKNLFQWFHCDRIRLHSDLFLEAKVGNSPSVKGLSRVVNSINTACSLS